MNAKMYLVGVVGGIFGSLVLWFPLTEYLPSTVINRWDAASAGLAWGLILLACLIMLACGAVSARWSGTKNRSGAVISGAVAGWVAALVSYILVVGAAAGVWGARPILEFGLRPADNDAQFIRLLVDSITGIHWWTMLALWGTMLLGLGLGAIGGALAGPGGNPDPDMILVYQITAVSGILTGGLVLVIETAVLTLLTQSIGEAAAKLGLTSAYPTIAILTFPVVTTFLMMLASLLLWWVFYRRGMATGQVMNMQARLSAGVLLGVPILTLMLVFAIYRQPMFYSLYLPFFALAILAGFGIMRHVWSNSTNSWDSKLTFRVGMFSACLSFLVMIAGAYFSTVPASLGDVLLVVSSIEVLNPATTGTADVTNVMELVREHYATYRNVGLFLMLVILPAVTLVASGLVILMMKFFGRRSQHSI